MFRNVFYDTKKSNIHVWEQKDGKNSYKMEHWVPYVFEEDLTGEVKTIDGNLAKKVTFDNYNEYFVYQKNNLNCKENNLRPEIQFLAERYSSILDDNINNPNLKVYTIDIEVHMDEEFPKATEAKDPVSIISVYNMSNNKTISFGIKPYDGKYQKEDWLTYIHCKDEETLLIQFFNWMHKNPPDVISGWNCEMFDLQYLINRVERITGDSSLYNLLSPIKNVRVWKQKEDENINIDIAGVTILDYLDLYKWYSPKKLERYTLDYVAKTELEKGKVDYSEYNDLRQLYDENWNLYVEYNIIDALRVAQLEEKLGYIKLVQTLSLLTKAPMKFYHTQTALIEGMFITYFRRNNMCAPTFYGGTQESYPAAWVKEPTKGLHNWIIDLDITSSYPTAIITLNMSNETYYGRIVGYTEDQIVDFMKTQKLPEFDLMKETGKVKFSGKKLDMFNNALKKKLLCVAPCGSVFSTTTPGVIATVEKATFYKRVEIKKKMIKLKKSLPELRDKELEKAKEKVARYNSLQNGLKILLNATYGVLATPYFRYYNINIAEAIVSCGRYTIRSGERFVNDILNNPTEEMMNILKRINNEQ